MKACVCDKCGKVIEQPGPDDVTTVIFHYSEHDLCKDCMDEFLKWLKGEVRQQRTPNN